MVFFPIFLYDQIIRRLPYPSTSLEGQTYIVTGGNAGIGLEAARHFTRLGAAKVILGCRSNARGEEAKADIEKTTGRKNVVEIYQLDLSSFESVQQFADQVAKSDRIDGVVENAGIMAEKFIEVEGNESTITVNVVSTFLLALLLLPKLRKVSQQHNIQPRLVIVSSEVHAFVKLKEDYAPQGELFNTINKEQPIEQLPRYFLSKFLDVVLARELVADIEKKHGPTDQPSIIINILNPGLCKTKLGGNENEPLVKRTMIWLMMSLIARTAEMGSRAEFHAAVDAKSSSHGKYLSNCEEHPPADYVLSNEGKAVSARLYQELLVKLEAAVPGISNNI